MFRLALAVCLLALPLFAGHAFADDNDKEDPFAKIEITTHPVRGPVYALEGGGGTIGVSVGEDGILMIDDQFAQLADKIKAAVADLQPGPVQFIVNTHWHGDHTGGNASYDEAVILSHDNVRKRLIEGMENRAEPAPKEAWPVITFDHSVTIHFNGEAIDIMHFPRAHTDGDAVAYFRGSNVFHTGDLWFFEQYPYVDLPSGGNASGLMVAIEAILAETNDETIFIVGHGGTTATKKDLAVYRDFLRAAIGAVANGQRSGLSKEELMEKGMPGGGPWSEWEAGWIQEDQFIGFVYDSINQ